MRMIRFEIKGNPISVAFGFDIACGVFLSAVDCRLKFDDTNTKEVNSVSELVNPGNGTGCYFGVHTGPLGIGFKVDYKTMTTYLRRFGASEEHLAALGLIPDRQLCIRCATAASFKCSECRTVSYCSKVCQERDWPVHKLFCRLFEVAPEPSNEGKVLAVLLPENGIRPKLVRVQQILNCDDGHWSWAREARTYVNNDIHYTSSNHFPGTSSLPASVYPSVYHICCKNDFLVDSASSQNMSSKHILSKISPQIKSYWRGNLLLFKNIDGSDLNPTTDGKFTDIALDDIRNAIYFLYAYTKVAMFYVSNID